MPDLITHAAAAYFVTRIGFWQKYRTLFYLGTILPDLMSRPFYILFPKLFKLTTAMHTPIFIMLFCLLLAQLFEPGQRKPVLFALLAGSGLHFVLDLFQRHLIGGYFWLFPFSWRTFEIGWFWPEDTVRLVPVWLGLILACEVFWWWKNKRNPKKPPDPV